jgi:hypothetical protein
LIKSCFDSRSEEEEEEKKTSSGVWRQEKLFLSPESEKPRAESSKQS